MSATRTLTFNELWELNTTALQSANGLCYHPCCDVWTTRGASAKRASHSQRLKWKGLMATLDKTAPDKKQALLAKMTEKEWRLPAILNEACQVQPKLISHQQTAFRLHQPDIQPQNLQASLAPSDFIMTSPDHPNNQDAGIFLYYQSYIQRPLLFFKCNPSITSL